MLFTNIKNCYCHNAKGQNIPYYSRYPSVVASLYQTQYCQQSLGPLVLSAAKESAQCQWTQQFLCHQHIEQTYDETMSFWLQTTSLSPMLLRYIWDQVVYSANFKYNIVVVLMFRLSKRHSNVSTNRTMHLHLPDIK